MRERTITWRFLHLNGSRGANLSLEGSRPLAARRASLAKTSQLDMKGNPDSGGVWAPCLSYADGQFWLIYSDIKVVDGPFKDGHNYLVTADEVDGEWSDPVRLNSSGFDPSLFHDPSGKKYVLNMLWDHREKHHSFAGIALQEYSVSEKNWSVSGRSFLKARQSN